jgi:tetratricopeptide (TPR) repeat protein
VVEDLDGLEQAVNAIAQLPLGDPSRAAARTISVEFLADHGGRALERGDLGEAIQALSLAVSLWRPAELRAATPAPAVSALATALYRAVAPRGSESEALLALAARQQFGAPAQRAEVVERWALVEGWVVRNGEFADEPVLRHEELEELLERVAVELPSPFVVQRLADLYVARHGAAKAAARSTSEAGAAARHRVDVTGYLLIRLYLRADDPQGAIAALARIELDPPTRRLAKFVGDAARPQPTPTSLLALARQFMPDAEAGLPPAFDRQGWAIVEQLARRAITDHPDDAFSQLLLAQALIRDGLLDAAVAALRRAIELRPELFEAWTMLAQLQHEALERLAARDPGRAQAELSAIAAFHAGAAKRWRGRALQPTLARSTYVVARGLYEAGEVAPAEALLTEASAAQAIPEVIELQATIARKRGDGQRAASAYRELVELPHAGPLDALEWEVRGRQGLAELAAEQGDAARARELASAALRAINELVVRPELGDDVRADLLIQRGRLLYRVGDRALALRDFADASAMQPSDPGMFADPLLFLLNFGEPADARAVYRAAMERDDVPAALKVYFSLWIDDLAQRAGDGGDGEAAKFLASYRGERWPERLAAHARGDVSYAELLAAASDPGERAEAHFYEGLRRARAGDEPGARGLFEQVLASELMSFFEYDLALQRLGSPRRAAPPSPASAAAGRDAATSERRR